MKKLKLLLMACALLVSAGVQAKDNVTSDFLKDADLSSLQGWGNPGRTDWRTNGAVNVVEFWNWSTQFNFSQTANLPAGYYRLAVNAFYRNGGNGDGTNNNMAWIFAGEQKKNVIALNSMTDLSGYSGSNDLYRAATAFSQGQYSNEFDFKVEVEGDGTVSVEIGFKGTCPNSGWCILGPVTLYKYTAADYMEDYRAKVEEAEALYSTPMWAADLAALQAAVVDENTLTTVDEVFSAVNTLSNAIIAANTSITTYAAAIAPFNKLKEQADAIADVKYTETTAGSHATFTDAIAAQQTAATNAADAAAITAAITALKSAVKDYINAAEPKNDGDYFDVTCLMANPDFDDNTITGWTNESTLNPNTRIQCNEFFGSAAFDFYQTVSGLPNGSYTLSMKAFQRPGWYDGVYADYANGINNATAKIYVNSDESDVKNIMEEMNATRIYTDPNGVDEFNSDKQPANAPGFIPNSMEGAAAWFAEGKYQTEVAALVEEGSLRLGFKDEAHSGDVWTLFDEFRLHYYGSSKMIYYKQQLPQIKAAANADLGNALYASVTGIEKSDFQTALTATPASETEAAYKAVIDDIAAKQAAFRAAVTAYDALDAAKAYSALTKVSTNIGTGVFQYNATTNDNLFSAYETAKAAVDVYTVNATSTAAAIQTLVEALDDAIANYNNQALNTPEVSTHYNLTVATDGHAKNGNAVIIVPGATSDNNPTGYGLNANNAINANLAQAVTFTQVSGNTYNISFETVDGTAYLTYGRTNGSAAGWSDSQIQATTDDANKGEFKIVATTTPNVFNIVNTLTNTNIDCQVDGDIYTDEDITLDGFSIAEANQASVGVSIDADVKYGTRIFPFTPTLPAGVKAYSCEEANGKTLTLVEVEKPAAGTPYILFAENGLSSTNLSGWGVLSSLEAKSNGALTGVYTATYAPKESFVLQKNDGKVAFYEVGNNNDIEVPANLCYLTWPAGGQPSAGARAFFFPENNATAIKAINALTSGKAEIFNASGAKIPALQKGMNIIRTADGKSQKVMVK